MKVEIEKVIRIGTRKSKLALWQADYVWKLLNDAGIAAEIVPMETRGDKILDVSISKIGSKGVFTEELEEMLHSGKIDIAVHSAKDMQSELPHDFEILAFTLRENVNDVLVSHHKNLKLENRDASFVIGTSSTRRIATLNHYFSNIKTVEVRGNLQTRIRKMKEGHCDALLLAYAGVHRMNYDHMIVQLLDTEMFTPAVGQGSLAIESSKNMDPEVKLKLKAILEHADSALALRAERSFLKSMQGGCSIPAFALAYLENDKIILKGGIFSLDGKQLIRHSLTGNCKDPEALGKQLGEHILQNGGAQILKQIRAQLNQ